MAVLISEAVVLRTWPVHEADLIVSFFTRDYGKIRGVAKSALKSRKRFGGALEPMTVARAWFAERPRQELARLDQLEIVRSPLSTPVDLAERETFAGGFGASGRTCAPALAATSAAMGRAIRVRIGKTMFAVSVSVIGEGTARPGYEEPLRCIAARMFR